jgi:hypothetical protein
MKDDEVRKRRRAIRRVHSLTQVPGLEGLFDVCRRNRVTLTCHGGAARRIAAAVMSDATRNEEEQDDGPQWSIFDCVPFNSDVVFVHGISRRMTPSAP